MNKKQMKELAQEEIMNAVANALIGYQETGGNDNQVMEEIKKQADRVAKLMGFERAWHN